MIFAVGLLFFLATFTSPNTKGGDNMLGIFTTLVIMLSAVCVAKAIVPAIICGVVGLIIFRMLHKDNK